MSNKLSEAASALIARINERESKIAIIGMGYVGLPLAVTAFRAGFEVIGFDVDPLKIDGLNAGRSPIGRILDDEITAMLAAKRFSVTDDFGRLSECDAVIICVPTPLNRYREPDLSFVMETTKTIAKYLRSGQVISLESTTYPGTTRDVMRPILEAKGLHDCADFFMVYSPEREDPGNPDFHTSSIPKVVGSTCEDGLAVGQALYSQIVDEVVPVSSCEVAEAVKLTENIFRSVNIALVNELKTIYDKMGINIWDVINAAKTKPFGFMAFYPGPGLGGHCIPIDPFYLTWKAREYSVTTRFIELAGEVNTNAPYLVVEKLVAALSTHGKKAIADSEVLILGIAYKKNVEDMRESPAITLIEEIERRGGRASFHDPFAMEIPPMREHPNLVGRQGVALTPENLARFDAVLICTDHDNVDYDMIALHAPLVIDTRNAMAGRTGDATVVLA